ncbi:hypothetical protein Mapa_005995 [Marchantia paleacea]|nr:hypothetical protein Mapa_005995 [Marchantia paleacea]
MGSLARKIVTERCSRSLSALLPRLWTPPWGLQQRRTIASSATGLDGCRDEHQRLVDALSGSAKMIPVKGDHVSLLDTPGDFYEAIKEGIRNSRRRVVMASLYIGTGKLEAELVDALAENPVLRVTMLFDALRATRPTHDSADCCFTSSAAMLSCLLLSKSAKWRQRKSSEDGERLKVSLYRTPDLTKTLQWLLPARVNEVVGVCHLKAFVFDDHVLMTGANMSSSYFTDRQDRYIWFRNSPSLANHFSSLIDVVSSYSFSLGSDEKLLPKKVADTKDRDGFCAQMGSSVQGLMYAASGEVNTPEKENEEDWDTYCFPTIQMGPLGIRQDEDCTVALLRGLPSGTLLQLASPYFNLTPDYEDVLLEVAEQNIVEILTASPKANGFYGSAGVSGLIPRAYSLLEQNLYERSRHRDVALQGKDTYDLKNGLSIYEYERSGWTFHAKGLWCTLPGDVHGPSVTLVGSSNFGYRSRDRDLEAQVFVMTRNPRLRGQLKFERDALLSRAVKVDSSSFLDAERAGGYVAAKASQMVRSWL